MKKGKPMKQSGIERAVHEDRTAEVAHLLALAYMRKRIRGARRQAGGGAEKVLDDVATRARVATGERRTVENRR
ncbi:MAG: hypothetical protein HY897_23680 [Deltaproteobacteria bacterium]|nr:hypothetical protein [Deltaproteobacteria bacterium]